MEKLRLGAALALALFALVSCKEKTSQGPQPGPSASGSSQPAPSAAASTAPPPASLVGFEGQIDFTAQSGDIGHPTQSIVMLVKNDRIRLDTIPGTDAVKALGAKAFLLLRVPDKKLDIVSDAKKEVIELDLNNTDALKGLAKEAAPAHAGAHGAAPANEPPPKLTKTGKKMTIAGYSCEDWEVTAGKDQRKKAAICMADLNSTFFHLAIPNIPAEYAFASEFIDGQHFPMRITSYDDRTGAESGRLEVNKFDPHPLDAAKFEIPAGYNTIDMAQLLGAMSNGPGTIPGMPNVPGIPSNLPNVPHHRHH